MNINLNDTIKVRLTALGKKIHQDSHWEFYRGNPKFPYIHPIEDANGYSSWSIWGLMQAFGQHISIGFDVPFETEMIYDEHRYK